MKFRTLAAATAAVSLAAAPAVAQFERSTAPVEDESELAGGSSVVIGILAAAAVIGGIIILADGDDDDLPVSVG
ncbi:hypothetical protein GRI38_01290 [Altererythrobacter aurantiacus]|uniref:Uncharacterized protein n=1 Tax=Parapontixanthobacter aurantiacus TaxID=1463599 RepID=A0A844ZA36_9SPHN|nr:hypothetical protein [Parapontixanthobacter aurantiacus]MXO84668.1 hypothetical protein [Parapontixanthobacter aurantiacus]